MHKQTPLCRHLEIETYTWDVLPDHLKTGDIVDYVCRELEWVKGQLLSSALSQAASAGLRATDRYMDDHYTYFTCAVSLLPCPDARRGLSVTGGLWLAASPGARNQSHPGRPLGRRPDLGADTRLLIIAPHPDDEILAAGGLIQRFAPPTGLSTSCT